MPHPDLTMCYCIFIIPYTRMIVWLLCYVVCTCALDCIRLISCLYSCNLMDINKSTYTQCQLYISSLRFHNGLTHFWGPRDNEENLNHRAIKKQFFLNIIFNE